MPSRRGKKGFKGKGKSTLKSGGAQKSWEILEFLKLYICLFLLVFVVILFLKDLMCFVLLPRVGFCQDREVARESHVKHVAEQLQKVEVACKERLGMLRLRSFFHVFFGFPFLF